MRDVKSIFGLAPLFSHRNLQPVMHHTRSLMGQLFLDISGGHPQMTYAFPNLVAEQADVRGSSVPSLQSHTSSFT